MSNYPPYNSIDNEPVDDDPGEALEEVFERWSETDFLKFDRIENPKHRRPDVCAFVMLDELVPGKFDMVSVAEHDEIFLDVTPEQLQLAAPSEDIIRDLVRCGVRYDTEYECLAMFT